MKIDELNVALSRLEAITLNLCKSLAELTCAALEPLSKDGSEATRKFNLAVGDLAIGRQKLRWVLSNLKERQETHEAFSKEQDV